MSYNRNNWKSGPLFVKEVILPDKKESGIRESSFKKNSVNGLNDWKNGLEKCTENGLNTLVKIGNHEVRSVGLLTLEKKPLENYFEGTIRKKQIRSKRKHQKANHSLGELHCKELLIKSNGEETSTVSKQFFNEKESIEKDQKIEREKLWLKFDEYEKMKEQKNQHSYIMQRLMEKKYFQQQANLAKAWYESVKRRNQLKQLNANIFTHQKPQFFGKETSKNYCKICVSNTPQKLWNDSQDKSENPEDYEGQKLLNSEPTSNQSTLDNLNDVFFEKLTLVDEEEINYIPHRRKIFWRTKNLN